MQLFVTFVAATAEQFGVLLVTLVVSTIGSLFSMFGSSIGISSSTGMAFMGMVWGSAAVLGVVQQYWVMVWFVEIRTWSYKRRRRTKKDIGNWKGIRKEIMGDLRGK